MPDSLKEYAKKRDFTKTAEPHGKGAATHPGLRFVVQHHIARRDHYDFRLEWEGVLKSWAVPKGPSYDPRDKRLAVRVEDHPLDYRTFEGTIPKGQYGGGVVMVWDEGFWQPHVDVERGLAEGSLKFELDGSRLKGAWALVHMKPKPGEKDVNWLLIKEKDQYENLFDIARFTTSIQTGRAMKEIEQGTPPEAETSKKTATHSRSGQGKRSAPAVSITHPEKILFPGSGITKGDVAEYYRAISERMLPYVAGRILSVVRCPGGIDTACFYKKHPENESRGVVSVTLPGGSGKNDTYYYIEDAEGLLAEVQMNTLEFHVWGSKAETLDKPDVMVFDLDPDEGMDLARIRQGVKDMKNLLDGLSLTSFLKTSGGKGYHVVVPFRPAASWSDFEAFAKNAAKTMEAMWPDRYTSNVRKNKRNNRIFIDWIRNGRGATSIAPYSVRAREGAHVSMPIEWKELDTIEPGGVTMKEAVARSLGNDPWEGFFDTNQKIKS